MKRLMTTVHHGHAMRVARMLAPDALWVSEGLACVSRADDLLDGDERVFVGPRYGRGQLRDGTDHIEV